MYEATNIHYARIKFEAWIKKVQDNEMKAFYTLANTVNDNLDNIPNCFKNRHTNTKPFYSKIKLFKANLRGVTETRFFVVQITYIFCLVPAKYM